ncbi:MAG: DUF2061 domain-containing protein [Myxococcota bacterium]
MKTLSWRAIAAIITGSLAWAATGSIEAGLAMGTADTLVKFFVYYAHERAWARISAGYQASSQGKEAPAGQVFRSSA